VGNKEFGDGKNHITTKTHRVEFFSRSKSKHKKREWGAKEVLFTLVNKKFINGHKLTP
jgi:hypothetical protein